MRRYLVERWLLGEWEPCWGAEYWNVEKAVRRAKAVAVRGWKVRVWDTQEERVAWPLDKGQGV